MVNRLISPEKESQWSPKLNKKDFESLYKHIRLATDTGEVTWYLGFEVYVSSYEIFKKAVLTEHHLWDVLEENFDRLPLYNKFLDKPFVGGWDRSVLKWRLTKGV